MGGLHRCLLQLLPHLGRLRLAGRQLRCSRRLRSVSLLGQLAGGRRGALCANDLQAKRAAVDRMVEKEA